MRSIDTVKNPWGRNKYVSNFIELFLLFIIGLIVHALVLSLIFPGYYSPLSPLHEDFYLAAAIANSHSEILSYLTSPRPIGTIFFGIIGNFGIKGSIAAIVGLTILNCALTGIFIRKLLGISLDGYFLSAFTLYVYLLFSHPYFYTFYSHDAFAQLSFFLLAVSAHLYLVIDKRAVILNGFLLFSLSTLAFLAKETYALSALAVSTAWFFHYKKESFLSAATPFVSISAGLILSFIYSFYLKSQFVTGNGGAYEIDLSPWSVATEWIYYILPSFNFMWLIASLLLAIFIFRNFKILDKESLFFWGCMAASALAILPNALLPNHRYNGYSWSGAYLLYAALLLLPVIINRIHFRRAVAMSTAIGIVALCLLSPLANRHKYPLNSWNLFQEKTQRNLLSSLHELANEVDTTVEEKVLISGISFPFSPFRKSASVKSFKKFNNVTFDVITYYSNDPQLKTDRIDSVKFIAPNEVNFEDYTRILLLGSDGHLIKLIETANLQQLETHGFDKKLPVLFPDVSIILGLESDGGPITRGTEYQNFTIGEALRNYQQDTLSAQYFEMSTLDLPQYPMAWLYAAFAFEKIGDIDKAKKYSAIAVSLDADGKIRANPNFNEAIERIENSSTKNTDARP